MSSDYNPRWDDLSDVEYESLRSVLAEQGLPVPPPRQRRKQVKPIDILAHQFGGETRAERRAFKSRFKNLVRKEARKQLRKKRA